MKRRILFVCGRNQWRSPTAERIYRNDPRVDVRSAGVSASSKRKIHEKDVEWADLILVMERKHAARIRSEFAGMDLPEMECLDIPDDYQFMDDELVQLLTAGVEGYLQ